MANEHVLSNSIYTATINAPIEKVDIVDWLFNLPDAEYQRCHPAHIACGTTTTDDGKQTSINVEIIGDALVIQHYIAEVKTPHLCRLVSQSDSITTAGRTKLQVTWELSVKKIDANTCEYSNLVHSIATRPSRSSKNTTSHLREQSQRGKRRRAITIAKRRHTLPRVSSAVH